MSTSCLGVRCNGSSHFLTLIFSVRLAELPSEMAGASGAIENSKPGTSDDTPAAAVPVSVPAPVITSKVLCRAVREYRLSFNQRLPCSTMSGLGANVRSSF